MSTLIKNMDIPSSCIKCRLLVHDEFENYYYCSAARKGFDENIKNYEECKPEWCPLEEGVPIVHAQWSKEMRYTEDFMGNRTYGYKCSHCGNLAPRYSFCGHCGATMDEEVKE